MTKSLRNASRPGPTGLKRVVAVGAVVLSPIALSGIHGSGLRDSSGSSIAGIHGSGARGIHGSGSRAIDGESVRGIHGSGARDTSDSSGLGIHGSGLREDSGATTSGIHGSGARGIHGSGMRNNDESSVSGIHGSGARGIHGSGARGIHGSGARGIHGSGARGIHGSGARGIHGSGARGIHGSGARSSDSAIGTVDQVDAISLFSQAAMGPVESVSVNDDGTTTVVVLGQTFISDGGELGVSVGDYVIAASTAEDNLDFLIPVGGEYLIGISEVWAVGSIEGISGNGSFKIGDTFFDFSAYLSEAPEFSPQVGDVIEVSGTQPGSGGDVLLGIHGSGVRGIHGSGQR